MTASSDRFWETTPVEALDQVQWEALCDGCAKCCLHSLEDSDSREIRFTNVCCRHLDAETGRCRQYANRLRDVPDCVTVTLDMLQDPFRLPSSCAYRLLAEGKSLPAWHPLISGTPSTVISSGNSAAGRVVSELEADDLQQHLIDWIT